MSLTATSSKQAKTRDKTYRMADEKASILTGLSREQQIMRLREVSNYFALQRGKLYCVNDWQLALKI